LKLISNFIRGDELNARVMRSSAWTVVGFGTSQVLRLTSNLILTRLLYPEAFGMMALVMVFMMGLAMFSDVGVGPSIMQSKRGDDPDFLNTAWTIQVIRGTCLWLFSCAMAIPVAHFYNEPQLAELIPIAGLGLLITGFTPTRLETAQRHLVLGRVSMTNISTQVVGILAAIGFALLTKSVWAFVLSSLVSIIAQLWMYDRFLPGARNHFRWEKEAVHELVHFGKWIFLSTVAGFLFTQGDKVILGKYLSIEMLGIYNIGYFLASFPLALSSNIIHKILIPLYRERPPSESPENYHKMRVMRFGLTALLLTLLMGFAFIGVWLVNVLYDLRYMDAGAIVVLTAVMQIPLVIVITYDQAALAAGDSKRFFVLAGTKAVAMVTCLIFGVQMAGLFGAIISQAVAIVFVYPVVIWLARRQGAWDPLHDFTFAAVGTILGASAIWFNLDAVLALQNLGSP